MPDSFDYTTGTNSENVRLLQALIDDAPEYTEETNSRNANILKSIINNTEYTDAPQSEIEELLLRLKAKIGGEIEVNELNVTENGTYDAGVNKAYNPVNVELPLSSKTITENGTYTASDDNLAGFNEVTVAVEGYAKKSIANTPTDIATFNASALPMPSLTVGIEATQLGNGDPSPQNVRPISGWTEANVTRTGKNLYSHNGISIYDYAFSQQIAFSQMRNPIFMKGGQKYVLSLSENITLFRMRAFDKFQNLVTNASIVNAYNQGSGTGLVFYANGNFFGYNGAGANSITVFQPTEDIWFDMTVQTTSPSQVMFEIGDTPSTYEPYNGHTYTTALKDANDQPLTCYGGQLVNENGVQSLDDSYDCFELYERWNWVASSTYSGAFYIQDASTSHSLKPDTPILCTHAKNVNSITDYVYGTVFHNTAINIRIMSENATVQDFKNYIVEQRNNGTPIKVCIQRATPQQIPQQSQAISTQDGTNNLWADSGKVISGEYMEAL